MIKTDIAVVGGGASGIVAAVFAARAGGRVLIVEKNPRIGKKILATGNGRCNILNTDLSAERFHGDVRFAQKALSSFGLSDMLDFFDSIALPCVELENGKMYPRSLQATSVLDLLREELDRLKIECVTDFGVVSAEKKGAAFVIRDKDGREIQSDKIIFSCGGCAAPAFGTDGSAYRLLKPFGHSVGETLPSLVQLQTQDTPKGLKGIKHDCTVSLICAGKKIKSTYGEVLFTDYGLSGPPIFDASGIAAKALSRGDKTEISLDLLSDIEYNELAQLLSSRKARFSYLARENFLNGLLPKRIGLEILKRAENPRDMARLMKNFRFTVTKTTGFKNAQVTSGGIATGDIDAETFMSKKVKNLYITGEMLDVDGDCGGFNLSWAWCSGALAGISAGKGY